MSSQTTSLLSSSKPVYDQHPTDGKDRYSRADLHCHSLCSDGALSVEALIARAAELKLSWFSITDHDTIRGQEQAHKEALKYPQLRYISGVEWSTLWQGVPLHVVGLNFALDHPSTRAATDCLSAARHKRTQRLLDILEKKGFWGLREWLDSGTAPLQIGRPHLARFLVATGQVKSTELVFKQLLGAGKVGDVKRFWPDLPQVVDWITSAGGVAVLAHPQRYALSGRKQRDLVADFAALGGQAIELGLSGLSSQQQARWLELALAQGLLGSAGSDFHEDDKPWARLGQVPAIPAPIQPVWTLF